MKGKWIVGMMICMLFCGIIFWQAGGQAYADQTAVVATDKGDPLNMRAGVGPGTAVLTVIPTGSQVTVLDTAAGSDGNGAWYKITYNGQEGFVAGKYISFTAVFDIFGKLAVAACKPYKFLKVFVIFCQAHIALHVGDDRRVGDKGADLFKSCFNALKAL